MAFFERTKTRNPQKKNFQCKYINLNVRFKNEFRKKHWRHSASARAPQAQVARTLFPFPVYGLKTPLTVYKLWTKYPRANLRKGRLEPHSRLRFENSTNRAQPLNAISAGEFKKPSAGCSYPHSVPASSARTPDKGYFTFTFRLHTIYILKNQKQVLVKWTQSAIQFFYDSLVKHVSNWKSQYM